MVRVCLLIVFLGSAVMEKCMQRFIQFFTVVEADARMGCTHVSIYMALLSYWKMNRYPSPLIISRKEIMSRAKVRSRHTYNVCMHQLNEYGYIHYLPGYDPTKGSQVFILSPRLSSPY